jgi:hypothetical protein
MTSITELASSEEVALFNPAFLARLVHGSTSAFVNQTGSGMPPSLPFLSIPLVLHKPTREDLPRQVSTQMQKWIRENPRHLARLDTRVVSMRPFVGVAIRYGLLHGVLVTTEGRLTPGTVKRRSANFRANESAEVEGCLSAASFLGRWFSRQPDAATLLALWGLRP